MCRRVAGLGVLSTLATLLTIVLVSAPTNAQNTAGVHVDPDGVFRTRMISDPSGRLTRQHRDAAQARLDRNLQRPSKERLISLNRLEMAIAEQLRTGAGLTEEMRYLAGMTRLERVYFFPDSKDIVIGGPAEGFMPDLAGRVVGIHSGRSVLELQDLVTALRSYGPQGKRTNVISVSIDPTPEGLAKMQQFLVQISGRITPGDANFVAKGLRESLGLQMITIEGVSTKTHFAQVLVEADYRMKLIGIGLEKPPVGITSYVSRANPRDVARNAMQRWYFTPNYECVRVSEDKLAMQLVGEGVKLIGENEMVVAGGGRVQSARVDRASQMFVQSFTTKYSELARKSPVYAQLRNLIDMSIAAAFIQQQDYYGQADWRMEVLGDESALPVETYQTPKQVETAVNVVWKGRTLMTPIGGGVNIQPRKALATYRILSDSDKKLHEARQGVSLKGLADGQWWWDKKVPGK